MANPEHLEILKQGVEVWNEWRNEHVDTQPDLRDGDFSQADLSRVNLTSAYLVGANLRNAILRSADFKSANLGTTDLSGADLRNADLSGAILRNAILRGAILSGADFTEVRLTSTTFGNNDLSEVKGLETASHIFPSTVGVDTIYKSHGKIPEAFLRGCGLPEPFIVQIPALIAALEPIQFYACFISFTEADDVFSERLYNDLQAKGVRCWRWKEDAKWGKTLMHSIDEAVRVYDKLIVICSEQSLNSPAVIREIERALQKEDDLARQGREAEVLFPIRLDDYIFTEWNHHRKADVTAKNVGDFCQWKNHDSYRKAFDRLLRDLKAEG